MDWLQPVFIYCERGASTAFWAEPLNALSNGAFLLAAAFGAIRLSRGEGVPGRGSAFLIALVSVIGIGSFLFHTFANRWSELADVGPIAVFMLAFVALTFSGVLRAGAAGTALGTLAFLGLCWLSVRIRCGGAGPLDLRLGEGGPCLNGTLPYLPALLMMLGVGGWLLARGRSAGLPYLAAAAIFALSMTLRTLDGPLCPSLVIGGYRAGSHFVWHLLNALTLYVLLVAHIGNGRDDRAA